MAQPESKFPPVKNTSGEGFAVEDKVAAWLACHLLAGIPWPNQHAGFIRAINCQMRQDGWHFDDFVLEIERDNEIYRCGCSVKSFPVIGKEGFPLDFRRALWEQWQQNDGKAFNRDRDILALFCAPHETEVRETWQGLLDFGRSVTHETFAKRHDEQTEPSHLKRLAFKNARLGGTDGMTEMDSFEGARMLQRFHFQEQDFDHLDSQTVKHAQMMCQQALEDSDRARAIELWQGVLAYSASIRNKGGRITLDGLLSSLSKRFLLKQHPRYSAEWQQITTDAAGQLSAMPTKIGGAVEIARESVLHCVVSIHEKKPVVVLLGNSGNGKTVIAHRWATGNGQASCIWVRGSGLCVGGLKKRWSLIHDLPTLFQNSSHRVHLVLDGLDKCFEEGAFTEAAMLIKAASTSIPEQCKIVLTCCPDDWERVQREFIRRGVALDYEQVPVGGLSDEELKEAQEKLPQLKALWVRPHLKPILRWPKALDIAVTYWRSTQTPDWANESDFARWFWQAGICQDNPLSNRGRLLRKIATDLADQLAPALMTSVFNNEDSIVLRELAQENLVIIDSIAGTVRIAHELIADWARLHELRAQATKAVEFLRPRFQSPMWHRALRFYALDLLEHRDGAKEWQKIFQAFSKTDSISEVARNVLLEAPVFASYQLNVLKELWPSFAADDGALLRRFLRQFLRVGTLPNQRYMAFFREQASDVQLEASVRYRVPWPPYWYSVIRFLHSHCDEVVKLAREEVADICLLWLRLRSRISSTMDLAAKIAVAAARHYYRSGEREYSHGDDVSPAQKICAALLAAAQVEPAEVTELVLKLSGRRAPDEEDGLSTQDEDDEFEPPSGLSRSLFAPSLGAARPWPEGPVYSCNDAFREAFMNSEYVAPLISALPDVSAEVMFATLLDIPRERSSPRDDRFHLDVDEYGFNTNHSGRDLVFWIDGPFLTFLRLKPEIALPAIIRLINFATDRAIEIGADIRQPIEAPIVVDNEVHLWKGHQYSYLWHEGHVFGPRVIGCALMSLEKWLYMLLDEGLPVDDYLDTLVKQSRSIAIGAVLINLGKRKPELFLGKLRPILASAEFHWLVEVAERSGENRFQATSLTGVAWMRSKSRREIIQEWVQLAHRKINFGQLVLQNFFSNADWRKAMEDIRRDWDARINNATAQHPVPAWLPRMAAPFDVKNWNAKPNARGTQLLFEPQKNLPQPTAAEKKQMELVEKLLFLPVQCSRILSGEEKCTEEQIQVWWDLIPAIREIQVPAEEQGLRNVEDALCGIVAVAIVYHRAWLRKDKERESNAHKILSDTICNPPPAFWLVEGDICGWKWDIFVAWAMTTLWVEHPQEPFFRESVAVLALWERYMVVNCVLCVAATHRKSLGKEFEMLFSHAVHYAPVRHHAAMERYIEKKSFDLNKWWNKHIVKFKRGRTPVLPGNWNKISRPQRAWRRGGKSRTQTSGMDFGQISAAMGWMKNLDDAYDEKERKLWLARHRQCLLCVIERMKHEAVGDESDLQPWERDAHETLPYKDESEILERVAGVLARLKPGEQHELLWEPILSLGNKAPHWIRHFVDHWLIEAVCHENIQPAFQEQWLAMLHFAQQSPAWVSGKSRAHDLEDARKTLLGLSILGFDTWRVELRPAVKAAEKYFIDWARENVSSRYEARKYLYFLQTPAADPICLDGLLLLKDHVEMDDKYFWKEEGNQDAFAQFLQYIVEKHWATIASSQIHREAFMQFGLKLTALQHPLGSEVLTVAANRLGKAHEG